MSKLSGGHKKVLSHKKILRIKNKKLGIRLEKYICWNRQGIILQSRGMVQRIYR